MIVVYVKEGGSGSIRGNSTIGGVKLLFSTMLSFILFHLTLLKYSTADP